MTRVGGSIFIPGPTMTPFPLGSPAEPITMGAAPCSPSWAAVFDSGRRLAPGFDGRRSKLASSQSGRQARPLREALGHQLPRRPRAAAEKSTAGIGVRGSWQVPTSTSGLPRDAIGSSIWPLIATRRRPPCRPPPDWSWGRGECGEDDAVAAIWGIFPPPCTSPPPSALGSRVPACCAWRGTADTGSLLCPALPCLALPTPCSLGLRLWGEEGGEAPGSRGSVLGFACCQGPVALEEPRARQDNMRRACILVSCLDTAPCLERLFFSCSYECVV